MPIVPTVPTAPEPLSASTSDEVLYHLIWDGDLRAFDLLYRRYAAPLMGFLLRMVHNHHDAEDLFHEAFLSVLRGRQVTFDRASFATWLYRIARNVGLNHLRTQRRRQALHAQTEGLGSDASLPVADEALAQNESAAELGRAVDALPQTLAELYRLRTAGLSYEQMAAELQLPLGTVKSRMNQMTLQLQARLQRFTDGKE
ncbi:MAG TPA: sigma-70 family RNA polymerase sigma factor [Pseudomonadota bacterium]|nr:sigma-70 family RNA polymerase sigma factor [Pseudomonadota bacterium]